MFEAKQLLFYYCISPVHMGSGSAIGAIDNPIQREVHTEHPMLAGSGLKGAARHHFTRNWKDPAAIKRLFGPDTGASDHAGAIAFTDAQLVAFPVRSLKNGYVYTTSPTALARVKRLAAMAGVAVDWDVPSIESGHCYLAERDAATDGRLILEAFDFAVNGGTVRDIGEWLAAFALPDAPEYQFFRDKLKRDFAVLSDAEFGHFVRHATVVEPHVRIDDASGTADGGGLFYTENLPPESILAGLLLATIERRKRGEGEGDLRSAEQGLKEMLDGISEAQPGLNRGLLQIGGDATTGRGLVVVNAAKSG